MYSKSRGTPRPFTIGSHSYQLGPVADNRTDTSNELRVGAQDNSPEPSASQPVDMRGLGHTSEETGVASQLVEAIADSSVSSSAGEDAARAPVLANTSDPSRPVEQAIEDDGSASQVDTVRQRSGQDTQPSTPTRKEDNRQAFLQNDARGGGTVLKCRHNQSVTSTKTPSDSKHSVDPEYSVTALDNTATNERSSRNEAVFFKIFIRGLGCSWALMMSFKLIMPLVQTILPVSLNTMPPVLLEGLYGLSLLGMGCCLGYALKVLSKWPYASTLLFLLTMSVGLTYGFLSLGWPADFLSLMDWMPVMILTVVTAVILSSTCSAFKQIAILRRTNFVEEGSRVFENLSNPRGTVVKSSGPKETLEPSPAIAQTLF